jgi:hypothetical protein
VGFCADAANPLENAHAHNDYWHDRPLLDALEQGFTSVEADIFLVDGELLVGHAKSELRPERTLDSLYLAPLSKRIKENGGRVYHNGNRFYLLVDVKSGAEETYRGLVRVLSRYSDLIGPPNAKPKGGPAVTVIISGNRPQIRLVEGTRSIALDGRLSDLDSKVPPHLVPMLSDNWTSHFNWNGDGAMPDRERAKLKEIVGKAHSSGRVIRFWATPEKESAWRELLGADVDLIGTDKLERLASFLRAEAGNVDIDRTN